MVEDLRISMIQSHIIWGDREENLAYYGELIRRVQGRSDLAILPETFTTGFAIDEAERLAEPVDGPTLKAVRQWAADYDIAIAGSFIVEEDGRRYNRAFFMTPAGEAFFYDKRHLFRMAGENTHFSPWSRNQGNAYDLLIYVANWPEPRRKAWKSLLQARAIENMAYVCGVNRVGIDGNGIMFRGDSLVYDPKGKKIADAGKREEITRTCVLSHSALEEFRTKFPAWMDADAFDIHV